MFRVATRAAIHVFTAKHASISHPKRKYERKFLETSHPRLETYTSSDLRFGIWVVAIHHFSLDFEFYSLYTINQSQQMTVAFIHEQWKGE